MDIMRTHPMVIIGGILQENPFFVPPDRDGFMPGWILAHGDLTEPMKGLEMLED